ncbi:DUF885 domain-containing protein [Gimibacter soli]|uniref:DUF885 family protein n=1 Tax=Gimibacter soli TaxID=3024400 RepID=A0AAF0BL24_9PROT|nr:DUF885 family protein [Gimibacter soli]WCL52666.1 DUF885 family protein [Gimibacter soli]
MKLLLALALGLSATAVQAADKGHDALSRLFAEERQVYYAENPGSGPMDQPQPMADEMPHESLADFARRELQDKAFLDALHKIDRAKLTEEDQLNYDMFAYMIETRLLFAKYRTWRIPLMGDTAFHAYSLGMGNRLRFRTADDYETYIRRMQDIPRWLEENVAAARIGIKEGFVVPAIVIKGVMPSFDAAVVGTAEESTLYAPFRTMSDEVSEADQAALRAKAKKLLEGKVLPAYKALADFMHTEYLPAARQDLAAVNLPDGKEFYDAMVRYYTTLDITADEVHALGVKEVARIRAEMDAVMKDAKFDGTFKEFQNFLRTDPQFYAKSPQELLMYASWLAKRIDHKLPSLFGKLPRQPYGVVPVPDAIAKNYTTGRYSGATLDSPTGGEYWVNTYALDQRPLYELPSLTLHEAVPGHHLQNALGLELENVPEFRLELYPHAFGEGWGLYSEKLGLEIGLYTTPYEQMGRLSYEMWRACRLVIDTGIHSKGWSREQAIQFMTENTALSPLNISAEIDRYIAWPGQALAYKMGELKILELRARAEKELGQKFDIRAFHDRVLSAGGVPLTILDARIDSWIKVQKAMN